MSTPLNVIALISGGKDSLFSILHCLSNGHRIIALANLHPPTTPGRAENEEGDDINSYMYQTVGHSIVPLYAEALEIPLYRQEILGGAVCRERDYGVVGAGVESGGGSDESEGEEREGGNEADEVDETESLIPLLKKVMAAHPEANAVSTGAILSTYQRTRVESVALRLGLTPLSYLWQYPLLPPYSQSGLLNDMAAVGQDSRIIKVASGGLDQSFLWENVAGSTVVARLGRAMARFGENGDGAVLGEGGEYETLAVDGPAELWKRRIEVQDDGAVVGEGGSAVFRGKGARTVEKDGGKEEGLERLRIPEVWDDEFKVLLETLVREKDEQVAAALEEKLDTLSISASKLDSQPSVETPFSDPVPVDLPMDIISSTDSTLTISNLASPEGTSPSNQLQNIMDSLHTHLTTHNLTPSSISHITISLREISHFAALNALYSSIFKTPNPPSRVTIACGSSMPQGVHVMLSAIALKPSRSPSLGPNSNSGSQQECKRNGLHVQSRSYWAPANIGPYSQAISIPLPQSSLQSHTPANKSEIVYIAGQIPLIPSTMDILTRDENAFEAQTTLALQHLWRIGRAVHVQWWTAGVAYISSCADGDEETQQRVRVAQAAWEKIHRVNLPEQSSTPDTGEESSEDEDDDDEHIDPWDLKNRGYGGMGMGVQVDDTTHRSLIPDPSCLSPPSGSGSGLGERGRGMLPPCFVVEVSELPRLADIEWHSTGLARLMEGSVQVFEPGLGCSVMSVQGTESRFFAVEVRAGDDVGSVGARLNGILGEGEGTRVVFEHVTLYVTGELRDGGWSKVVPGVQWLPCRRVWGAGGKSVAGVLVGTASVVSTSYFGRENIGRHRG